MLIIMHNVYQYMSYTSGAVIIELVASVMVEVEYANYTLISGNIPVLGILFVFSLQKLYLIM